ncbi:MAG: hypothetical protein ACI91G_001031 [Gammaproteobacteria bacterium]|jgi:hypothetical protein
MSLLVALRRITRALAIVALGGLSLAATAQLKVPSGWVLDPAKIQGRNQFHVIAGPFQADFGDGKPVDATGNNGSISGPVLVLIRARTLAC